MLKLEIHQNPPRSIWLVTKIAIGKDSQNDIILNAPGIDDFHALFKIEGDTVYLIDKSTQGIFINGERIVERKALQSGDKIMIGGINMDIIDPKQNMIDDEENESKVKAEHWTLKAITGWLAGQDIVVDRPIVLGRDEHCDVTIPGTHLSLRHAEISLQDDMLHVKDLGSINGTFLNGERINEADVMPGDEIRFDLVSFLVLGPEEAKENKRHIVAKNNHTLTEVDERPAVRVGEAKPTSLGNSEEAVRLYNEQLAALKKEKKAQARQAKRDTILGWVIVIAIIALLVAIFFNLKNN